MNSLRHNWALFLILATLTAVCGARDLTLTEANHRLDALYQKLSDKRAEMATFCGHNATVNTIGSAVNAAGVEPALTQNVWATDHLKGPGTKALRAFYDSHRKKLKKSYQALSNSQQRERDIAYLERGLTRWLNVDQAIRQNLDKRLPELVNLARHEQELRRLQREEYSYRGPQKERYDAMVAAVNSRKEDTYAKIRVLDKQLRALQNVVAFSALDAPTRAPTTLGGTSSANQPAKVTSVVFRDIEGLSRQTLFVGEEFFIEVQFDQAPASPGSVLLTYAQTLRNVELRSTSSTTARSNSLQIGRDVPATSGGVLKASREGQSAQIVVESPIFLWRQPSTGLWTGDPKQWVDDNNKLHTRNPGTGSVDQVNISQGTVSLDSPARVKILLVDGGTLHLRESLQAAVAQVKRIVIRDTLRVLTELRMQGEADWYAGDLDVREFVLEKEAKLSISGPAEKHFWIEDNSLIQGHLKSSGALDLSSESGAQINNYGIVELADKSHWRGTNVTLLNGKTLRAKDAILDLPFISMAESKIEVAESLTLAKGGKHDGIEISGPGTVRLSGVHEFKAAAGFAQKVEQIGGEIRGKSDLIFGSSLLLSKGSLSAKSALKVFGEVRQGLAHSITLGSQSVFTINEDSNVTLKGQLTASKVTNLGILELDGANRQIEVNNLDNQGELAIGPGVELQLKSCEQLRSPRGLFKRSLLEQDYGASAHTALAGGTWNIQGEVRLPKDVRGKTPPIMVIGPDAALILRKAGKFGNLNRRAASRRLFNLGTLELRDQAKTEIGVYTQEERGHLFIEKGSSLKIGINSTSDRELFRSLGGTIVVDGELEVYNVDQTTFQDRRVAIDPRTNLSGCGTINGKTVDHFGGRITKTSP